MKWFFLFFISTVLSCSNSTIEDFVSRERAPDEQIDIAQSIFSDSIMEMELHIFYEPGAEPYTGNIGITANDTWDVMKESTSALFSTHTARSIIIPDSLVDMNPIAEQSKNQWTFNELKSLGDSLAPNLNVDAKINMSLIFLNGNYEGSTSTLGIHLGGTHYAFIFKDIVQSVGGDGGSQRYVEQATAVHELGHALGLVNNGLPMASPHEDADHRAHTSNSDGVMYWAVESSNSILTQILDSINSGTLNLFGSESLADARAHHP